MDVASATAARLREQCAAESSQLGTLEDGDTRLAALLQVHPRPPLNTCSTHAYADYPPHNKSAGTQSDRSGIL